MQLLCGMILKKIFILLEIDLEKNHFIMELLIIPYLSSELKAISKFPNFNQSISKKSLEYYLRFLSVPAPNTIYENIYKVQSSEIVTLNFQNNKFNLNDKSILTKKYWSPKNIAIQAKNNLFNDYEISQNQIEKVLENL